jgi:hypothetical protein
MYLRTIFGRTPMPTAKLWLHVGGIHLPHPCSHVVEHVGSETRHKIHTSFFVASFLELQLMFEF